MACIIDVPLSLTHCSGRGKQNWLVKLRERMKTPVVVLLMCYCHLHSAVVDTDKVCQ